jgi:predicted alpha/beta-hydrolase family hydrolase
MDHPFMREAAAGLADRGIGVVRFNFPYIEAGRKAPDRGPVLEATYEAVVAQVANELMPRALFLGGKSMGGRIGSYLPGRGVVCDGLVFLGYPLHPPGRPDRIRDQHLYELRVPALFLEGTRDPFCPLPLLEEVRAKMTASTTLIVVEDGDHSFHVRKSSGRSSTEALDAALDGVAGWIGRHSASI